MNWLARYRADYRALRALDGGRSPVLATLVDAIVLLLMLLDVLAIVGTLPATFALAVRS